MPLSRGEEGSGQCQGDDGQSHRKTGSASPDSSTLPNRALQEVNKTLSQAARGAGWLSRGSDPNPAQPQHHQTPSFHA